MKIRELLPLKVYPFTLKHYKQKEIAEFTNSVVPYEAHGELPSQGPGPGCSKLPTSLVNVSLKF